MCNNSLLLSKKLYALYFFRVISQQHGGSRDLQYNIFSSFFFRKNYLWLSYATSVRPIHPSFRLSSVEITSFRGNLISDKQIDFRIGLNVGYGVVHVLKAWFFKILIASCKFTQLTIFCK